MSGRIITARVVNAVFFPLDSRWRLDSSRLSAELSKQVVWLSGMLPFAHASRVLERLAQVQIPTTTLWEQTQRQGQRLQAEVEHQREQVSVERTRWEHWRYDPRLFRSLSLDGGMVNIRGEGWKEMKVGVVSAMSHDWQAEQPVIHLTDLDYTAVIGNVQAFAPAYWALAVQHDVPYAGRTAVTADGAPWIWRLCADLFPCSTQIVDWYHARQQLAQAATARHPHCEQAAKHWFEQMSQPLFDGEIWKIIADLQAHDCAANATYFTTHQRRMQYVQFRAEGYPIGSGAVESGIKQFKQRLSGAGMRWSRTGAERMTVIRAAVLTNSLDQLWQQAA